MSPNITSLHLALFTEHLWENNTGDDSHPVLMNMSQVRLGRNAVGLYASLVQSADLIILLGWEITDIQTCLINYWLQQIPGSHGPDGNL